MIYDPNGHRSWQSDMGVLKADKLPSTDPWFKSWYLVESSMIYTRAYENQTRNEGTWQQQSILRYRENMGHTIASIMAHDYGKELGLTEQEINFYAIQFDNDFFQAFENFLSVTNVFSIHQLDTNYAMNSTSIASIDHELLKLYKLDNNFFKNFVRDKNFNTVEEYKDALARSVETISYTEARKIIDGFKYFERIDKANERPAMNLEIALFSSSDFPNLTINQQFSLDSPNRFIVYGQSNNFQQNPAGTDVWKIIPDPVFYNSVATVKLLDAQGHILETINNVDIKTDFANGYSGYLPPRVMDGQTYTIAAEVLINGVLLSDSMQFSYHP